MLDHRDGNQGIPMGQSGKPGEKKKKKKKSAPALWGFPTWALRRPHAGPQWGLSGCTSWLSCSLMEGKQAHESQPLTGL